MLKDDELEMVYANQEVRRPNVKHDDAILALSIILTEQLKTTYIMSSHSPAIDLKKDNQQGVKLEGSQSLMDYLYVNQCQINVIYVHKNCVIIKITIIIIPFLTIVFQRVKMDGRNNVDGCYVTMT